MGTISGRKIPRIGIGLAAVGLSLYFISTEARGNLPIFIASCFFFLICITDTLYSRIPNIFTLCALIAGFGIQSWINGPAGIAGSLLGMLTGFSLLIIPHLMGGMGAGDVKALAALGAILGPLATFQSFLYMGLIGGALSIIQYVCDINLRKKLVSWGLALRAFAYTHKFECIKPSSKGESLRFPYAAAIAFGFFAYLHWGRLI